MTCTFMQKHLNRLRQSSLSSSTPWSETEVREVRTAQTRSQVYRSHCVSWGGQSRPTWLWSSMKPHKQKSTNSWRGKKINWVLGLLLLLHQEFFLNYKTDLWTAPNQVSGSSDPSTKQKWWIPTFAFPRACPTEEHQVALEQLVTFLTNPPVLAYPDFNIPFTLHTDASEQGLGAVWFSSRMGNWELLVWLRNANISWTQLPSAQWKTGIPRSEMGNVSEILRLLLLCPALTVYTTIRRPLSWAQWSSMQWKN